MRKRLARWIMSYANWLMMDHKWAYLFMKLANKLDSEQKVATVVVKNRYSR